MSHRVMDREEHNSQVAEGEQVYGTSVKTQTKIVYREGDRIKLTDISETQTGFARASMRYLTVTTHTLRGHPVVQLLRDMQVDAGYGDDKNIIDVPSSPVGTRAEVTPSIVYSIPLLERTTSMVDGLFEISKKDDRDNWQEFGRKVHLFGDLVHVIRNKEAIALVKEDKISGNKRKVSQEVRIFPKEDFEFMLRSESKAFASTSVN